MKPVCLIGMAALVFITAGATRIFDTVAVARTDITPDDKAQLCAALRRNLDADGRSLANVRETNDVIQRYVLPRYPPSAVHEALVAAHSADVAANSAAQSAHDDVARGVAEVCRSNR